VYRLEVSHIAHRQIRKLPVQTQDRINNEIARLAEGPRPPGVKKLTTREGYRVRVGDYRFLYRIDDSERVIVIYRVMGRGDGYKL
jgi:mRNA interferase RelE/StbE